MSGSNHKAFFPVNGADIAGLACAALGLMIAAGGGVGGGGILIPTYVLVLKFHTKFAVPLSNCTILGGAIANMFFNLFKRNPIADRPLIAWDIILIMEPLTMCGALIGSFINKVLPSNVLVTLLVIQLLYIAGYTIKKGLYINAKERDNAKLAAILEGEDDYEPIGEEEHYTTHNKTTSKVISVAHSGVNDALVHDDEQNFIKYGTLSAKESKKLNARLEILEKERHQPARKILALTAIFSVVLVINLLKGGGEFSPLGIRCGSIEYWALTGFLFIYLIGCSLVVRRYLLRWGRRKAQCNYEYIEGDVKWTRRSTVVYPCICFFAGLSAGLFGVGGGVVKGPLMLWMGVDPTVASATSACMILFTSFTAATSFIAFGLVQTDYAVVLFLVGIVATAIGQTIVIYLVNKYQRSSPIIISIGAVLLLSAILLGGQELYFEFHPTPGEGGHPGGICGAGE